MKKLIGLMLVLLVGAAAWRPVLSVLLAPDGIQIGPEAVLPIKEFDEYAFERGELEMTAGEVRTLNFGSAVTFHGGAHCFAEVYNPYVIGFSELEHKVVSFNNDKFLILHAWFDGDTQVMVKNLSSSTVTFANDQIVVACLNTTNFRGQRIRH